MRRPILPLLFVTILVVAYGIAVAPQAGIPSVTAAGSAPARTRGGAGTKRGARHHHPRPHGAACPGPKVANLPQTMQLPSSSTAAFRCEMSALWNGIRSGRLAPAMPAFFPEAAYVQIKAITDPQADWQTRLVDEYAVDLQAAHALLGSGAARAKLLRVYVPPSFAHVIDVNVCSNRDEYWETPNARLIYELDGAEHSLGIASMISWHGYWFVVHLGAVQREGNAGLVDAPSSGVGVALPSSTC